MKHIYIVEGASGSGKSTLIKQQIADRSDAVRISRSITAVTGSRLPTVDDGMPILSAANDLSKVMTALSVDANVVFIDRLVISQAIYQYVRELHQGYTQAPVYPKLRPMMSYISAMFLFAEHELSWRTLGDFQRRPYALELWMVNHQEYGSLKKFRASSEKTYPAGVDDWLSYRMLADEIAGCHNADLPFHVRLINPEAMSIPPASEDDTEAEYEASTILL